MSEETKIKIRDRWSGEVLYEVLADSLGAAVMKLCAEAAEKGGRANLRRADLSGADLSGANLTRADLRRADLTDADLSGANLSDADLSDAELARAILTDASGIDTIVAGVPVVANLHQQIEAATRDEDALDMGSWHTCATTHCRAGWAVTLAGDAGKALEASHGPAMAGAILYLAAGARKIPDWYASNDDARADIVRCADEERASGGHHDMTTTTTHPMTIWLADRAYQAVRQAEDTGVATYPGGTAAPEHITAGMVLRDVCWTTDRGNWTWDGVMLALEAMGVDCGRPL